MSIIGTNKTVKDIQTGIQISGDKITGISNYVTGITGAGGDGNYLVIELPQAKDDGNTVKCQFEGGRATTLSTSDWQYFIKLKNKKTLTITITGKVNATRTIDISDVVLLQDITKVVTVRDGSLATYNKTVNDLQENVTLSKDAKFTGTLKHVTDYQNGTGITEGNWLAIHINKDALPSENVKVGFEGSLLEPDKKDWNYNFRIDEERKEKPLQIEVDGKVLYLLDLTGLKLNN